MNFGFINLKYDFSTKYMTISTLPNLEEITECIRKKCWIENDWLYPPIELVDGRPTQPFIIYELPVSHNLEFNKSENEELYHFIILLFGFLNGMQLVPEKWGHFYKTPFKKGKLVSFHLNKQEIIKILDIAYETYINSSGEIRKMLYSAIHWFLLGQSYIHGFEKFDAQYRVTDCCFKLFQKIHKTEFEYSKKDKKLNIICHTNKCIDFKVRNLPHSKRIEVLCLFYKIPIPWWACYNGFLDNSKISSFRNDLLHEAIYCNEPIGIKIENHNYDFWLSKLNERIILLLLGINSDELHYKLHRSNYRLSI